MLSIGLWRRYINITITVLVNIHRLVFYLKHDNSETEFCLRLQAEPTHLDPVKELLCLRKYGDKTQPPKRSVLNNDRTMNNVQNCDNYVVTRLVKWKPSLKLSQMAVSPCCDGKVPQSNLDRPRHGITWERFPSASTGKCPFNITIFFNNLFIHIFPPQISYSDNTKSLIWTKCPTMQLN
jgi:hypothetical protein